MTQGGVKRTQPLLMAAGSNKVAGKLPVATIPSLLDTVVVTRRRRRVTSFAFPSGGAPTGASADGTSFKAATTAALTAAMPTVTMTSRHHHHHSRHRHPRRRPRRHPGRARRRHRIGTVSQALEPLLRRWSEAIAFAATLATASLATASLAAAPCAFTFSPTPPSSPPQPGSPPPRPRRRHHHRRRRPRCHRHREYLLCNVSCLRRVVVGCGVLDK